MQGQPAGEAPASNLQELLKEIKELKEGLLVRRGPRSCVWKMSGIELDGR
jgi:hypothetical protein